MNSSMSEDFMPSPVAAHQASLHSSSARVIFETSVAQAILTACLAGAFTASVSTSSTSSLNTQYVMTLLNQGGYQAQVTGSNLVINW